MPLYQIALVTDSQTARQILEYYQSIRKGLPSEIGVTQKKIPHITLATFKTQKPLSFTKIRAIQRLFKKEITIKFAGLRLLPSKEDNTWVEISVLKSNALEKLLEKIVKIVIPCQFSNEVGDQFRPHITLCHVQKGKMVINQLDYPLLRKETKATLQWGIPPGPFRFKPKK
jgi:2'-5' RNA ligase